MTVLEQLQEQVKIWRELRDQAKSMLEQTESELADFELLLVDEQHRLFCETVA